MVDTYKEDDSGEETSTGNDNSDGVEQDEGYITKGSTNKIVNEFALVEVRKIQTPKGERLEIESPKKGHVIRLDALELESLTWQEKDIFDEFLRDPHGPSGHGP
jgi:hypothetical protein